MAPAHLGCIDGLGHNQHPGGRGGGGKAGKVGVVAGRGGGKVGVAGRGGGEVGVAGRRGGGGGLWPLCEAVMAVEAAHTHLALQVAAFMT